MTSLHTKEVAMDVTVMGGLVFIIGVIIYVHATPIYLTTGALSTTDSRILTVGVTAGATVFTSIVGSRLKAGFLRSLEDRFQSIPENPHLIQDPTLPGDDHHQELMRGLERDWRSMLSIETFVETLKNYRVFIAYLLSGLITTSIVTSLAPTMSIKMVPYNARIPDTNFGFYTQPANRSTYGICLAPCNQSSYDTYQWSFQNGSWVYIAFDGESPASYMPQVVNGINPTTPDDYVYADSGVAVQRSAIGAPTSIFSGNAYGNVSSKYAQALKSLTQCVPVMVSNPVRCQKSGNVTVTSDTSLTITTGNITSVANSTFSNGTPSNNGRLASQFWNVGGYTAEKTVARNFSRDSAMANWIGSYPPSGGNTTEDSIGVAVLAFGAVNDPDGVVPFANYLAGDINDPDNTTTKAGHEHYAVTCIVDPRHAFEYRRVTLDLQALGNGKASNYAQYLSGGGPCTPLHPTISNKMFAVAGTAASLLVNENAGVDGNVATLTRLSGNQRGPPYAFPDSANALEDVLGLISALAVSRTSMDEEGVAAAEMDPVLGLVNATAVLQVTRLGSDGSGTLWLLIPPLASLVALATLFVMGIRRRWAPGGAWFPGADDKRPDRYVGESVFNLVMLGMTASKNAEYKKVEIDDSDALSVYTAAATVVAGSARSSLIDHGAFKGF